MVILAAVAVEELCQELRLGLTLAVKLAVAVEAVLIAPRAALAAAVDLQVKQPLDLTTKLAAVAAVGAPAAEILIHSRAHKVAEVAPAEEQFS
jgi:hypothetical protein